MDFREASALARNNPGSTLTRDENGLFIVQHPDGSLVIKNKNDYIGGESVRFNLIEKVGMEMALLGILHNGLKLAG